MSPDLLKHPLWHTADFSANDVMVSHEIAEQCRQEKYRPTSNKSATLQTQADCTGSSATTSIYLHTFLFIFGPHINRTLFIKLEPLETNWLWAVNNFLTLFHPAGPVHLNAHTRAHN